MSTATLTPSALPGPGARSRAIATFMLGVVAVLWLTYVVGGFRPPTQAIVNTDGNAGSGLRQVLFAGGAALSGLILARSGQMTTVLRQQAGPILLVVLLVASTAWSLHPGLTVKRGILAACGATMVIAFVHVPRDPLRFMQQVVGGTAGAVALTSLAWWLSLPAQFTVNPERPGLAGISNHPNTLAPMVGIGLIVLVASPAGTGFMRRSGRLAAIAGCTLALLLSQSISSIAMTAVAGGVALMLRSGGSVRVLAAATTLAAATSVWLIGPSALAHAFLGSVGRDASFSGRDELWPIVLAAGRDRPIIGSGWGAFWTEGKGRELTGTWNPRQSHNAYLDLFVDLGLLGLVAVLGVIGARVLRLMFERPSIDRPGAPRGIVAGLTGLVVALLVVYALQQSFLMKVDSFPFVALLWIVVLIGAGRLRR